MASSSAGFDMQYPDSNNAFVLYSYDGFLKKLGLKASRDQCYIELESSFATDEE